MSRSLFISLPVADLSKSTAFFKALGFDFNPQFTGDTASCVVINDATQVMLATHDKFTSLTPKAICDTRTTTEMLLALDCASPEEVDELVAKALKAGGSTQDEAEDLGFMYSHGFCDPDGHQWGLFHMRATPPQ